MFFKKTAVLVLFFNVCMVYGQEGLAACSYDDSIFSSQSDFSQVEMMVDMIVPCEKSQGPELDKKYYRCLLDSLKDKNFFGAKILLSDPDSFTLLYSQLASDIRKLEKRPIIFYLAFGKFKQSEEMKNFLLTKLQDPQVKTAHKILYLDFFESVYKEQHTEMRKTLLSQVENEKNLRPKEIKANLVKYLSDHEYARSSDCVPLLQQMAAVDPFPSDSPAALKQAEGEDFIPLDDSDA